MNNNQIKKMLQRQLIAKTFRANNQVIITAENTINQLQQQIDKLTSLINETRDNMKYINNIENGMIENNKLTDKETIKLPVYESGLKKHSKYWKRELK